VKRSIPSNNFDLLRLCAALQVVHSHAVEHLRIPYGPVGRAASELLALFPGVPIFFVISGFLISRSYERTPSLAVYFRNRALRIYPALWTSFAVSLVLVAALGAWPRGFVTTPTGVGWVLGQLSIVQFFNPAALRGFGVGVLNGSLWTIPVELQFYLVLPLIYRACVRGRDGRESALRLGALAVGSFGLWCLWETTQVHGTLAGKLLQVTIAPHLFMFLAGVWLQRSWARVAPLVRERAGAWTLAYVAVQVLARVVPAGGVAGAIVAAAGFALLAVAVVSMAFTRVGVGGRLLRGRDCSYGVYLYHMLVVNALVALGWTGTPAHLATVFALTFAAAAASWSIVERPALSLKISAPAAV